MPPNFILFSDLQKKVTTSPIKTWRLLDRLRQEGRMQDGDDYLMLDRKLFVNVPRFIVELQQMGYNLKSPDIKSGDVISDEIKKLTEEMRLISDEITHRSIQEELKSSDITNSGNAADVKSSEIKREEPRPGSDGISPTTISPEINLKSPEFNMMLRSKDEIIEAKKEQIEDMKAMYMQILKSKDEMLNSKDEELKEIRSAMDTVVKHNETLVHHNVFLTRLLTGPQEERPEPKKDDVISHDFRDVTEVTPETEERATDPEPVPTAAHETPMAEAGVQREERATPDVQLASDHLEAHPATPEQPVAQA